MNAATLVSKTETLVNGLTRWSTLMTNATSGVVTRNVIAYSNGGYRTETEFAPNGSYVVRTNLYGRLLSVSRNDSLNNLVTQTSYGYDFHGRQGRATDMRNGTTVFGFNNADQVNIVTTPVPGNGDPAQVTTTLYDGMQRAWQVTQPDTTIVTSEYFPTGLLKKTYGSRTYPVEYSYDTQGRMKTMTTWRNFAGSSGAAVTTWNYNPYRGWLDNKRYDDGRGPDYTYTNARRLRTRLWARGSPRVTTTYGYNSFGDLWTVVYSNDPAATPSVTYGYDRRGRQSTIAQSGATTITVNLGLGGVPTGESYSGGALSGLAVASDLDPYLRRTGVGVKSGSTVLATNSYAYDSASRLWVVGDNAGNTATYDYVPNSLLVSQIIFRQGTAVRLTTVKQYDFLNRLQLIASTSANNTWSYGYDYNGANQRNRMTLSDGSFWSYDYDTLGQVTSGKRSWADGTPVPGQQFEYGFDDIGNRNSSKAGGDQNGANLHSASYTPNNLNQYSSRTVPGYVTVVGAATPAATVSINNAPVSYRRGEYFWGEVGVANGSAAYPAISVTAVNGSNSATPTSGNVFVPPSTESFLYDYDGSLTLDGRWAYTWDAENRLIKVESLASGPAGSKRRLEFEYDARSRRIRKKVTNLDTSAVLSELKMVYDGWNLLGEWNVSGGALARSYAWGLDLSGSLQGGGGVGGLVFVKTSTATHAAAYDGNGNVTGLTDVSQGAVSAAYEYGPFGETVRVTGPVGKSNPLRFSTRFQDNETDVLYFGYRYYSASTGRWINRDRINEFVSGEGTILGPQFSDEELHLYRLLSNDAINSRDLLGLCGPLCDPGWLQQSVYRFSASDVNYAARVVYAEASCSSEDDQYAVASVIRNRIGARGISGGVKNTLTDVANAPGQFAAVVDRTPKFLESAPDNAKNLPEPKCACLKKAISNMKAAAAWGSEGSQAIYSYDEFRSAGNTMPPGWTRHGANRFRDNPNIIQPN